MPRIWDLNTLYYLQSAARRRNRWTLFNAREEETFIREFIIWFEHHWPDWVNKINVNPPIGIGFTLYQSNLQTATIIARFLRENFKEIPLIAGGPQVQYEEWTHSVSTKIAPFFDSWVVGEGEAALKEIVTAQTPGRYHHPLNSMMQAGFPDFSHFELKRYGRQRALPVSFSRGCIHRCTFCAECRLFPCYKQYDPGEFVERLQEMTQTYHLHWVTFLDSLINGDFEALAILCEKMINRGLKLHWDAQLAIRPDMPMELFRLMKRAGCNQCFIGLETASNRLLQQIRKPYHSEEAAQFLENMKKNQLFAEISLIVNLPGEEETDFHSLLDFFDKYHPLIAKIAQINPFIPLPGTPYYTKFSPDSQDKNQSKIQQILAIAEKYHIPYTKSYIQNLNFEASP